MRVMVIGGGGREHALVWKLSSSPMIGSRQNLYCVPGNAGIEPLATCLAEPPAGLRDVRALANLAQEHRIDFTVVGPELPLTMGLADELASRGLACFGATRAAARLEGSKVFAKQFMERHGIPTAPFAVFDSSGPAIDYLGRSERAYPTVVKADGLAAGKGVVVAATRQEAEAAVRAMIDERQFGEAGARIVIEECLVGHEASFFAMTDGDRVVPLATCQDYKRALDGDRGPNTGGMGAVSPSTQMDATLEGVIMSRVVVPTVRAMALESAPYRGVLYVGLMLTPSGPMVLEYNARFGDPETQVLMPRYAADILPMMLWAAGRMEGGQDQDAAWRPGSAACVVLASRGYPGASDSGRPIDGLQAAAAGAGTTVFHAATRKGVDSSGREVVLTAGGRVLAVSAVGRDLEEAVERAYAGAGRIKFEGMQFRRDIGGRTVATPGSENQRRGNGEVA